MIVVDKASTIPLYVQLYEAIKQEIISGVYSPNDKLPSARELTRDYGVSRNTVMKAYQQLYAEGYVVSFERSAYRVDPHVSDVLSLVKKKDDKRESAYQEILCEEVSLQNPMRGGMSLKSDLEYDFRYCDIPDRLLSLGPIRRAASNVLASANFESYLADEFGSESLREQIATYIQHTRGVNCCVPQIVLHSGTRDVLERLLKLFNNTRDIVAIEQPGWRGAMRVFASNSFSIAPLSMWPRRDYISDLEKSNARIVYVTPSHQFPTGVVMPYSERIRLLEWAHEHNGIIIEDDYDSELRYGQIPIPSLQSLDRYDNVVYLGTCSKIFSPGLRTGYMVLPKRLVGEYRIRLESYWCPVPWLMQNILAELFQNDSFERQVRRLVKYFHTSQEILIKALDDYFGPLLRVYGKEAGLHLWLSFDGPFTGREIHQLAAENGVGVYPTDPYWFSEHDVDEQTLLMGYSDIPHELIRPGVERLREIWPN